MESAVGLRTCQAHIGIIIVRPIKFSLCCCCFVTLTLLVKNLESVVTQRCWSSRKIRKPNVVKIRPGNTTLSRLKTHDTEKGAQVKRSNVQTEVTWPPVSTQLQHRAPPFPLLTNSRLQTTEVGLPAPYKPHGNRGYRRTRLLSGVLSE